MLLAMGALSPQTVPSGPTVVRHTMCWPPVVPVNSLPQTIWLPQPGSDVRHTMCWPHMGSPLHITETRL